MRREGWPIVLCLAGEDRSCCRTPIGSGRCADSLTCWSTTRLRCHLESCASCTPPAISHRCWPTSAPDTSPLDTLMLSTSISIGNAHIEHKGEVRMSYADTIARTAPLYDRVKTVIPPMEWPVFADDVDAILALKRQRNAVILGHNYMTPEIFHCVADIVGDSLALAREAT